MEITNIGLEWDSDDVAAWQNFLMSKTGKRLLPKALESTPELLPTGDTNAIFIRTGEVRGFQEAIRQLLYLSTTQNTNITETATNYPSLVDDAKWADGEKIKTE